MNTPVELRNITNDTGKSSTAQRSACMKKFNAYLRHDQVHLTLPSDINWSTLRIDTVNGIYMSIRYNNNMNQQQINDSFNMKLQHLIDGQQKLLDIQHSMPSTVTQNIIASISTFTINPVSSSDIQPPPKRQRQMLLTPSVSLGN